MSSASALRLGRVALLVSALSAACSIGGTLDNVPNHPAVEVTRVSPNGPRAGGRPECPANPPTNSCPVGTRFHCELDTNTGCDVCSCSQ